MADAARTPKRRGRRRVPKAEDLPLTGTDAVVEWKDQPPAGSRMPRQIHARRPAPPVPRGKSVPDTDKSPPVNIEKIDE